MLRSVRLLPVFLGALINLAMDSPADAAVPSISGSVLHEDGMGLPGVRVELLQLPTNFEIQSALLAEQWPLGEPVAETRTDATGRFELVAPELGLWRLRLSAPGLLTLQALTVPVVEPVELPPVSLRRSQKARIQVIGGRGQPLTGIGVYAVSLEPTPEQEAGDSPWRLLSRLGWSQDHGQVDLLRARGESLDLRLLSPGKLSASEATLEYKSNLGVVEILAESGTKGEPATERVRTLLIQEADGTPIADAIVSRLGPTWPLGRSSEQGLLTVEGESSESAALVVFARDGRALKLTEAAFGVDDRAMITLGPAVGVSGRVFDVAGQPISGALVWPRNEPAAATRTDSSGWYTVPVPAPGKRHLEVRAPGFLGVEQAAEVTVDAWGSLDFELIRGTAPNTGGGRFSGHVLDPQDRPLGNVEVRLVATGRDPDGPSVDDPELEAHLAETDANGRFQVSGPAVESLDIVARGKGFAPLRVRGVRVPLGVAAVDLGTLVLAPGVTLTGVVRDPHGQPLAGAEIWRREPTETIEPLASPVVFTRQPNAVADAAGRFVVPDLEPGQRVDLWIDHHGFLGISMIGVEAPNEESIGVVLEPAGQILGVVVSENGTALGDANVTLQPASPEPGNTTPVTRPSRTTATDSEGHFSFPDAFPGDLEVSVVAPGFQPSPPQRLALAAHQEIVDVRFVLVPGARLTGWVFSGEGEPVADARVLIDGQSGTSDDAGRFEVSGITPGLRRLQVVHPGYNVLTRQLDIEAGSNRAELELIGGYEVSGWVFDESGRAVAGAIIELEPLTPGTFGGYRTPSDDTGAFRLDLVAEGRYRVVGSRGGYVTANPESTLNVTGGPARDVEVLLQAGAKIQGEILGLSFEELSVVEVEASSDRYGRLRGAVDYAGGYEISDLSPGDWLVTAELGRGSRQARARVVIEPGVARVVRDLELDGGVVLSGVVLHAEAPLAAARVTLHSQDSPTGRAVTTAPDGRFTIENLEPSLYRTSVAHSELRLIHNEDLRLDEDRDVVIEIATVELSGRVVEGVAGEAVPSVNVVLRQILANGRGGSAFVEPSGSDGEFRFANLPAGRFKLQAQHNGYRPAEIEVEVAAGSTLDGVRVVLESAAGLELMASLATGARPNFLTVRGRDDQGRTFAATRVPDGEGYAKFSSFPAGDWQLLIGGTGSATTSLRATIPGDPIAVVLPAAGRLRVRVADLVESESYANLIVTSTDGLPFQHLAWGGALEQTWPVAAGQATVEGVPSGVWNLRVEGPSGRIWTGVAVTTGGPDVGVTLE